MNSAVYHITLIFWDGALYHVMFIFWDGAIYYTMLIFWDGKKVSHNVDILRVW